MVNVYLLKKYNGYGESEIIMVEQEEADTLIENGTARLTTGKDYLVKPEFHGKKFSSRALGRSPKIK